MKTIISRFILILILASQSVQAQRFFKSVNCIVDLKAINTSDIYTNIAVLGGTTPGNGSGGLFYWDSNSTAPTNTSTVFKGVTTGSELSTGRWLAFTPAPIVSLDEISYLSGVSGGLQGQLDLKATQSNLTTVSNQIVVALPGKLNATNPAAIGQLTVTLTNGVFQILDDGTSLAILGGYSGNTFGGGIGNIQIGGRTGFPHKMPGALDLRLTIGSYDGTNAGLQGTLLNSPHSYVGGTHSSALGGSYLQVLDFCDYSGLAFGTLNTMDTNSDNEFGIGGSGNFIQANSAYGGFLGGRNEVIGGNFSWALFDDRGTVTGNRSASIGGISNVVSVANSMVFGGTQVYITNSSDKGVFYFSGGTYFPAGDVLIGAKITNSSGANLEVWTSRARGGLQYRWNGHAADSSARLGAYYPNAAGTDNHFLGTLGNGTIAYPWSTADWLTMATLNSFVIGNSGSSGTNQFLRVGANGIGINTGVADAGVESIVRRPSAANRGLTRTYAPTDATVDGDYWGGEVIQNPAQTTSSALNIQLSSGTPSRTGAAASEILTDHANPINFISSSKNISSLYLSSGGNVGIGGQKTFGSSAVGVLALATSTAPTTSPADAVQLYSADQSGRASDAGLHVRTEGGVSGSGGRTYSFGEQFITPAGRVISFAYYSGSHSVQIWEEAIATTTTATMTLPASATDGKGAYHIFKCEAGTLTIARNGSDTIDAAGTSLSLAAGEAATLIADGTNRFDVVGRVFTASASLAAAIGDETGSGALAFATSPALVTPDIGVATATTVNKVTLTTPASGSTLTIADGKTLTANNTLTFQGNDGTVVSFPSLDTWVLLGTDQSITNSTTLADVSGLTATLAANKKYIFEGYLHILKAGGTSGYKIGFNGPASPTYAAGVSVGSDTSANLVRGAASAYGQIAAGGTGNLLAQGVPFSGFVLNGSNTGNLTIQFAQSVIDILNGVTVKAGSWFHVRQMD